VIEGEVVKITYRQNGERDSWMIDIGRNGSLNRRVEVPFDELRNIQIKLGDVHDSSMAVGKVVSMIYDYGSFKGRRREVQLLANEFYGHSPLWLVKELHTDGGPVRCNLTHASEFQLLGFCEVEESYEWPPETAEDSYKRQEYKWVDVPFTATDKPAVEIGDRLRQLSKYSSVWVEGRCECIEEEGATWVVTLSCRHDRNLRHEPRSFKMRSVQKLEKQVVVQPTETEQQPAAEVAAEEQQPDAEVAAEEQQPAAEVAAEE
jgi:hypothetical protein